MSSIRPNGLILFGHGPEKEWLIEGHGGVPDTVVLNLPHATFNGQDAQLEAALKYLHDKIEKEPILDPTPPPYPDKSFPYRPDAPTSGGRPQPDNRQLEVSGILWKSGTNFPNPISPIHHERILLRRLGRNPCIVGVGSARRTPVQRTTSSRIPPGSPQDRPKFAT